MRVTTGGTRRMALRRSTYQSCPNRRVASGEESNGDAGFRAPYEIEYGIGPGGTGHRHLIRGKAVEQGVWTVEESLHSHPVSVERTAQGVEHPPELIDPLAVPPGERLPTLAVTTEGGFRDHGSDDA